MAQTAVAPAIGRFLAKTRPLLIDGQWLPARSGKTFATFNPADGAVLTQVAEGDAADIDLAVKAARRAFEEGPWRKLKPAERSALLHRLADLIEANADELAQLETLDNGKPLRESRHIDLPTTIEHFRYYAGWPTKITGDTIPLSAPGEYLNYTIREPVGVVGQIIPWNFPLLMAAWKLGAALAAGNTVVLKPAEQTPLTALRLGELILEAGFPEGVVNIVPGYGDTAGAALAAHPDVDKIAFTGSTEVGRSIMRAAAGNLKRLSLELGGKSPNIIFPDADLSQAIPGALMGIFFNQGQVCAAGSRLYVQRAVYDKVVSAMIDYTEKVKQGPGIDPDTEMGPLVSREQYDRVQNYIDQGVREGAKIASRAKRSEGSGYFVSPTVLTDVTDDMTVAREEIFGPVVAAMPFDTIEDVVQRANASIYGLAAGVWTQDVKIAHRVAHALKAGTVWVNTYNMLDAASPWGGCKQSGFGREMGKYALELYTQIKSVWVNLA